MRLVATQRAAGMALGRDVWDGRAGSIPLVRSGAVLTSGYVQSLMSAGIHAVYVDDALSQGIEVTPALTESTRAQAAVALSKAFHSVPMAVENGKPISDQTIGEMEKLSRLILAELSSAGDAVLALSDLAGADAYTLQHSVDVCVLGLLLAQRLFRDVGRLDGTARRSFERIENALVRLGVGLLLHDVGKIGVPQPILNKPGPLEEEEWALIKEHPVLGGELITSDLVSYHAKAVIRSHHERWDGSGYPDGLVADRIPEFARIAAVADVYDAVTSERPYRQPVTPAAAHALILEGSGKAFDPQVISTFKRVVAPYPPGSELVLRDGRRALVADVPPDALDRPTLRIFTDTEGDPVEPYEISMRDHPELTPVAALSAPPTRPSAEDADGDDDAPVLRAVSGL